MFKDYKKYLLKSLEVYLFVLIFIFIIKLTGVDYFYIDSNNSLLLGISNFIDKYNINMIFDIILLAFDTYIIVSVSVKKNNLSVLISSIILTLLDIGIQLIINYYKIYYLRIPVELLLWTIFILLYDKKNYKRFIFMIIMNLLFQMISIYTRTKENINHFNNTYNEIIMNLDYIIMLIITHRICFILEGGSNLCGVEVGSFSLKKIHLKQLLKKLQRKFQSNLNKFKKKEKEEKLTIIIYIILSLLWNTLSVVLILVVAFLNDTFIECVFILTSFWLSKGKFGKAFHFNSMVTCFIVSNLSYFLLNRLTMPIGISIFVPILLGVGLSYVSSKFVKTQFKPLYRGMPLEQFEETILKVTEKDSLKYNICYDFYINKMSDVSLSFRYSYTTSGIRKIRDRINEKIKRLN